jgi:long-subunit acyl-CoA synthetase (AMP-forming)
MFIIARNISIFSKRQLLKSLNTFFKLNASNSTSNNIDDKIFLTDAYKSFTFNHLNTLSDRLSSDLFAKFGNKIDGQNIGIYCSNNYTYLISILAVWKARGVPMCLNPQYPLKFNEYFLQDSNCKCIINGFLDQNNKALNESLDKLRIHNYILEEKEFYKIDGSDSKSSSVSAFSQLRGIMNSEANKDQTALLLYTSGTSGK